MSIHKNIYLKHIGLTMYNLIIKDICEFKKDKKGRVICGFVCDCICGTKNIVRECSAVKAGRITSCGCRRDQYHKITGKKNVKFTGYEEISGKYWTSIKRSALLRNHEFKIDIKYVWHLFLKQKRKCALTNLELSFPIGCAKTSWSSYTASLDRIDSKKGYIKGNLQWVHKDVNQMKQQYNNLYFMFICNLIANKHPVNTDVDIKSMEIGGRYGKKPVSIKIRKKKSVGIKNNEIQ